MTDIAADDQNMTTRNGSFVALKSRSPGIDNNEFFTLPEPENTAAVTSHARYTNGGDGGAGFPDEAVARTPGLNPPASGAGQFTMACAQEVQAICDKIRTDLKNGRRSPVSCGDGRVLLSVGFTGRQAGSLCPPVSWRFKL